VKLKKLDIKEAQEDKCGHKGNALLKLIAKEYGEEPTGVFKHCESCTFVLAKQRYVLKIINVKVA
jgi:hypothetical protein